MASEIAALTELSKQLEASARRKKRHMHGRDTRSNAETVVVAPQPALAANQVGASQQQVSQSAKTVADRPMFLSSATAADFTAWEEAWH